MSKLEKKKVKSSPIVNTREDALTVIAVGDPHFQTTNIPEVNMFIDRLESLCNEVKPDLIVILGDLLHTHERLHVTPYNKALEFVTRMRNITDTIVLVGNHDMCFAEGTPILMWDRSVKYSQDIKVGDCVMGDDYTPRNVLKLTRGQSVQMYDIKQSKGGYTYTVTENHLLCLKIGFHKNIKNRGSKWVFTWMSSDFCVNTEFFTEEDDAYKFARTIPDIISVDISVCDFLKLREEVKEKLYGYNIKKVGDVYNCLLMNIVVTPSSETEFYGWETDGNHKFLLEDCTVVHNCNNQQYLSTEHWMNPMKEWGGVKIVDTVYHCDIKGYHLVFCPYVYPGRFQEALSTDPREWKSADCIFAHQEFYGCKMGAIVSVEGDVWGDELPRVVSGHIHSRQNIGKNVYYCGSSMQHAFGESEKNVIPVLRFRGEGYELDEVDLALPRKRIVYTDVQSIDDIKIPEVLPDGTGDKVKITISGVYDEFKAFKKTKKYRELVKTGTKVVFKPKKVTSEEKEKEPEVNETDFSKILNALILNERNNFLYQAYELIVNSKTISEEDIMFM